MFTLTQLSEFSSVAQQVAQSPRLLAVKNALLGAGQWDAACLAQQAAALCEGDCAQAEPLAAALRHLRSAAIAALAEQDGCHQALLETITGNITALADYALHALLAATGQELALRYGVPTDMQGQAIDLQVVAMGKHGGRELNVSSDIDIIFLARDLTGDTAGVAVQGLKRSLSNSEFLNQWARRCVALMNAQTAQGFVFRVDTLLRPHGSEGPLVTSHGHLEDYLVTQGRMWERLAWLKARGVQMPVFESPPAHQAGHDAWQALVLPFVYRRYLDYTVIDSLRELHGKIREQRRSFEAKAHNGLHVKLARGGIREIEFWAQGQQLIRAGRNPSLRSRATLPALQALAEAGVIEPATAQAMAAHYRLLRRAEHAVQYVSDAQTHLLPASDEQRALVAQFMGFASITALDAALASCMDFVAGTFDGLFANAPSAPSSSKSAHSNAAPALSDAASALIAPYLERVQALPVPEGTRLAVGSLIKQLGTKDAPAFERVAQFVLSISRRKTYVDILLQHPPALARLQSLMAASPFAAQYLQDHPALLDELIDATALYAPCNEAFWLAERTRLMARLNGLDEETQLHVLREAHHAWVLKVLAQDLAGHIDVRAVSDALSIAADIALDAALCCVHFKLQGRFELPAGLAIIGYGKLGGKELGYGSDLDIVFIYDPALAGEAANQYPRLVQRLISWLGVQTAAGRLFEIDTALRPNGQSGLMLSTLEAFAEYQVGHAAGTHAWLWEHQAISRARLCAGDVRLTAGFDAVRQQVLCLPRDEVVLKQEIMAMRAKVTQGHTVPDGSFDAKHSAGGMVDIEFAVQYLVLRHAATHPALRANSGNVALLNAAAQHGIISAELAQEAGSAYMALRTAQHRCKLAGQERAWVAIGTPEAQALKVHAPSAAKLWQALWI
jgi:[glutamine synthetase] adenylyltransferase / [glutamine synthetase]-adenylyl-L-tyrosine phosphorylase